MTASPPPAPSGPLLAAAGLTYTRVSLGTDAQGAATEILSPRAGFKGQEYASVSGDGRFVSFVSLGQVDPYPAPPLAVTEVYYRDLVLGQTRLVSGTADDAVDGNGRIDPASDSSHETDLSRNGAFIAFHSAAPLVSSDVDLKTDVYLFELANDELARLSEPVGLPAIPNGQSKRPRVSQCGRFVAYQTRASNLGAVPAYDTTVLAPPAGGLSYTNGTFEIVVLDRGASNQTVTSQNGAQVLEWISVGWDIGTSPPEAQEADRECTRPSISDDGGVVAFESLASNLVPGRNLDNFFGGPVPQQIYAWHRDTKKLELVSQQPILGPPVNQQFSPADGRCQHACVSGDGRYVAFASLASNLLDPMQADQNGYWDIFVADLTLPVTDPGRIVRVSLRQAGTLWPAAVASVGPITMRNPAISDDGRFVAYYSSLDPELADGHPACEYFCDNLADGLIYDRNTGGSVFLTKAADGAGGWKQDNGKVGFRADFTDSGLQIVFPCDGDELALPPGDPPDRNGQDAAGNPVFASCQVTQGGDLTDPCNPAQPLPCNDVAHGGNCPCSAEGRDVYMRKVWDDTAP